MTASERVLLYATAIQTGLRSSELRSLTRGRLFLESDQPYITCKARSTKNAKDARQYIQPELAAELHQHVATKASGARVFALPPKDDVAAMLRADLADARRTWQKSARSDPKESARRQESDFLASARKPRPWPGCPTCSKTAPRHCWRRGRTMRQQVWVSIWGSSWTAKSGARRRAMARGLGHGSPR